MRQPGPLESSRSPLRDCGKIPKRIPHRLKAGSRMTRIKGLNGTPEELAEKVRNGSTMGGHAFQARRALDLAAFTARLKPCPSTTVPIPCPNPPCFSASCEVVPFPKYAVPGVFPQAAKSQLDLHSGRLTIRPRGRGSRPVVGQTVSHYCILEQIGAGGMGVVYRAHDERLDRDAMLKVVKDRISVGMTCHPVRPRASPAWRKLVFAIVETYAGGSGRSGCHNICAAVIQNS